MYNTFTYNQITYATLPSFSILRIIGVLRPITLTNESPSIVLSNGDSTLVMSNELQHITLSNG